MTVSKKDISDADLIEAIYSGIVDGKETERAMRGAIARVGASGGNLHIVGTKNLETRYFIGFGESYTDDAISDFLDHWQYANAHRDAMRRAFERHGKSVYLCHEHISTRDWERAAYFQDFFAKLGQRWLAGGIAKQGQDAEVSIAFSRALGTEHFGQEEARFIQALLPHVRRASTLAMKLGHLGAAQPVPLTAGLTVAHTPSALLGADGSIVWANRSGIELMDQCPLIRTDRGRLTLTSPPHQSHLLAGLTRAIDKDVINTPLERISLHTDREAYELDVLPASLPSGALLGAASVALVMFRRRGLTLTHSGRLREIFQFTQAEAELAILVAEGLSIDEAADQRGVKSSTVRAQLRSVFSKAGVTRANALAAKVWSIS